MIDDTLREELSALLDGVLPEERAKELRRRIREEPDLFREYAELERAVHAVRALPRKAAPPELRARIHASLGGRRGGGRVLRIGVLALAATVLLAVGLAVYLRREPPARYEAREDLARDAAKDSARAQPPADRDAPAGNAMTLDETGGKELEKAGGAAAAEAQRSLGAAKGERRAAEQKEDHDLLAAVAKSHVVPPSDRKAYLQQVAALGAERAREHVRAVVGYQPEGRLFLEASRAGGPPVLATILLKDHEEANLVKRILDAAPAGAGQAASLRVEEEVKDQLSAQVQGTPEDLARLERWLALLDLAPADAMRPRVVIRDKSKRQDEERKPQVESAVVRLRFGQAPEPKPAEAPPEGK